LFFSNFQGEFEQIEYGGMREWTVNLIDEMVAANEGRDLGYVLNLAAKTKYWFVL
jgi:hypothetical protein